jgi:hypothetical protein
MNMKTRFGFVSNSSSSSFVVAYKEGKKIELTVQIDLSEYGKVIRTIDELNERMKNDYSFDPNKLEECEDVDREVYLESKAAIEAGKVVVFGWFRDQSAGAVEYMLCHEGIEKFIKDGDDVQVIDNYPGY